MSKFVFLALASAALATFWMTFWILAALLTFVADAVAFAALIAESTALSSREIYFIASLLFFLAMLVGTQVYVH